MNVSRFVQKAESVCKAVWDGDRCQFERNDCTLQLCQNGATCTVRQLVLMLHNNFSNYHKHLYVSRWS